MSAPGEAPDVWGRHDRQFATVARNVSTRYAVIGADIVIGLLLLPFNLAYLGPSAYGLWMLTASVTTYFSLLDLGYGGALVKYVAQYRAWRDREGLNQIVSTFFFLFAAIGVAAYAVAMLAAFHLDALFRITPEQADTGRTVLLIVGVKVALGFPFMVFGGIVNGFQRYDVNSVVALVTTVTAALVNVGVLLAGYGLVELVAATTLVRVSALLAYRLNAYRIFPALRVRWSLVRTARLREVSGFSFYALLIGFANRMNYTVDPLVVGAFMGSAAVAGWTVAQRLISVTQRATNQVNTVLFPMVVDSDAGRRAARLRQILVQGTRVSLASVVPIAVGLALLAGPLVRGWVGPGFDDSVLVLQILAAAVVFRVGSATATTVLKGAGRHRLLALTNVAAGAINILLSVVLIGRYGLPGVAVATLLPVGASSAFILFPAACRRVGLSTAHAVREGVWPALWPGAVAAGVLAAVTPYAPPGVMAVAVQAALAGIVYLAVFFGLAISPADRRLYAAKLAEFLKRQPRLQAAA